MKRVCCICGDVTHTSPAPLLCQSCGRAETYVDVSTNVRARNRTFVDPRARRTLAENPPALYYVSTGFPDIDELLEGGLVTGTTSLIFGGPGSGKSTLSLGLAAGCAGTLRGQAYVLCPEMSHAVLVRTARRGGVPLERLVRCEEPEKWLSQIGPDDRVLLVDSVSKMRDPHATLDLVIEWSRQRQGIAICLVHQTRDGDPMGGATLEHDVDAVFRVTFNRDTHERRFYVEKSRSCGVGSLVLQAVPPAGAAPSGGSGVH